MAAAYEMGFARLADLILTGKGASAVYATPGTRLRTLLICSVVRASKKYILWQPPALSRG